mgnify:CR=1 FL=1
MVPIGERELIRAILELEDTGVLTPEQTVSALRKQIEMGDSVVANQTRTSRKYAPRSTEITNEMVLQTLKRLGRPVTKWELANAICQEYKICRKLRGSRKVKLGMRILNVLRKLRSDRDQVACHNNTKNIKGSKWVYNGFNESRPLREIEASKRKELRTVRFEPSVTRVEGA